MNKFHGRKVAVWGAARSGIAAANLLHELGADVLLSDTRGHQELNLDGLHSDIRVHESGNTWRECDLLIPSPGIPPHHSQLRAALRDGLQLMSEIELASSVTEAPIVAITGTDGKTTTTEMIGVSLKSAGLNAVVGGNIGIPLSEKALNVGPKDILIAEVSAFQLWSCGYFAPKVAVVTNIAHDHAEYFDGDHRAYVAAKARILKDMGPGQSAVLRADDAEVAAFPLNQGVKAIWFGTEEKADGWGLNHGGITHNDQLVMHASELSVKGEHNLCNAQCALATGMALGCDLSALLDGLRGFKGLPHRMAWVKTVRGVEWINDSKATNPHAAAAGLRSVNGSKIVIAGGYDKGLDFTPFIDALGLTKCVILVGPTSPRLAKQLAGRYDFIEADSLASAIEIAADLAIPADQVILSPAASSFDAFSSYGHRGRTFEELVHALDAEPDSPN